MIAVIWLSLLVVVLLVCAGKRGVCSVSCLSFLSYVGLGFRRVVSSICMYKKTDAAFVAVILSFLYFSDIKQQKKEL